MAAASHQHGELQLAAAAGQQGQEARELVLLVVKETQAGATPGAVGLYGVLNGWWGEEESEVSQSNLWRSLKPKPDWAKGASLTDVALEVLVSVAEGVGEADLHRHTARQISN